MDRSKLDTAELYRLLEMVEDPAARYHIRNAMQYAIALEEHERLGPRPLSKPTSDSGADDTTDED